MTQLRVPCKFCGKPTTFTGTQQCDACWEINRHIEGSLDLTIVYKSLFVNAPEAWRFLNEIGICTSPALTDECNTKVIHTVILAHLLGIKIQAARIGTTRWEGIEGVPTDFANFQFRKANDP